jgi:hypothetical protein
VSVRVFPERRLAQNCGCIIQCTGGGSGWDKRGRRESQHVQAPLFLSECIYCSCHHPWTLDASFFNLSMQAHTSGLQPWTGTASWVSLVLRLPASWTEQLQGSLPLQHVVCHCWTTQPIMKANPINPLYIYYIYFLLVLFLYRILIQYVTHKIENIYYLALYRKSLKIPRL